MTPLGAEIRRIRDLLGLSQKEHAQRIGVSAAYLSALEHGQRGVPTAQMLNDIIHALDGGSGFLEDLTALAQISKPTVTVETAGLQPEATELANRIADCVNVLSKKDLAELLARLDAMLDHSNPLPTKKGGLLG